MDEFGKQINFKQLLDHHQRVEIPIIQRDYAQGRINEEEVREEFLKALFEALSLPENHESLPLNLDFIYGSVEGEGETSFFPLDGQQRLTTLFLLHWYLAWKDDCQSKFKDIFILERNSRFYYSIRPSSTEFFNALVNFSPLESPNDAESLSVILTNQPWYFRHWKLDPTIQSSLIMLDAIHNHFKNKKGLFLRLIDEKLPAISFQLLDLKNFGLSDDLYIKMNARGKPLTAFETFKARYEQELTKQFEHDKKILDGRHLTVSEYFSHQIDTKWADFFWTHRNERTGLFDEAVINLFRAVALFTRDPDDERFLDSVSKLRNRWFKSTYSFFYSNGWLDQRFSEILFLLIESWVHEDVDFYSLLPDGRYFNESELFEALVKDPILGYVEIVKMVGYSLFIKQHKGDVDATQFQEWMRIISNLSVNTSYDRPADMQRSIAAIHKLVPSSGEILEHFAKAEKPTSGFNQQQISEEKLKAELIKSDANWRSLIERAENHGYFKGQIEFLLDYCGALEDWRNSGKVNWDFEIHRLYQKNFEKYLNIAGKMFDNRGLNASFKNHLWERALLSIGDYFLPSGSKNESFLVNSSTEQNSWKRLLSGVGHDVPEARVLLKILWDRILTENDIENKLDEVIANRTEQEAWIDELIKTPKAFDYCEQKAVRKDSNHIYLLKKTQMNGTHAELFTYCLYYNKLKKLESSDLLKPMHLHDYQSVVGTEIEPHILLAYERNMGSLSFRINANKYSVFIISVRIDCLNESDRKLLLGNLLGFRYNLDTTHLTRKCNSQEIEGVLIELAKQISS